MLGLEYMMRLVAANLLSGGCEGFNCMSGEQDMQQRSVVMAAERTRRLSFPSGRAGLVAL
jgi:hypothetical protein